MQRLLNKDIKYPQADPETSEILPIYFQKPEQQDEEHDSWLR